MNWAQRCGAALASAVLVLAMAAVLAGCDPDDFDLDGPSGCPEPGPLTHALLPTFDSAEVRTIENPCLSFADLVDQVLELIPPAETGRVASFLKGVRSLSSKVGQLNDVAECAYEHDRLGLGVYQSRSARWAVGIAAVVRGDVDAATETAVCFLLRQVPLLWLLIPTSSGEVDEVPAFCFTSTRVDRGGERYTLMWLASSNVMCASLSDQLTPGDGTLVAVRATPDVAVRSGPSRNDAVLARAPDGSAGRAACYLTGETITGRGTTSDLWARTTINGVTGYISVVYLDGGVNLDELVGPC